MNLGVSRKWSRDEGSSQLNPEGCKVSCVGWKLGMGRWRQDQGRPCTTEGTCLRGMERGPWRVVGAVGQEEIRAFIGEAKATLKGRRAWEGMEILSAPAAQWQARALTHFGCRKLVA